jgi:polysaccharide biosynthesis protein PslH
MTGEILFLAHRAPFPPDRGDKIRSWNILKALAQIAPVHVAVVRDAADPADMRDTDLGRIAASLAAFEPNHRRMGAMARALLTGQAASVCAFGSTALHKHVSHVLATRDIRTIYAYSGQMAQFVPSSQARFVMDFVDMDSAKFATYATQKSGPAAFANAMEAKRLFAFEKQVAQRADLSLFVSDAEAGLFRRETGLGVDRVQALENGIDLELYNPNHSFAPVSAGAGPLIVFTGQMDYAPNVEAVLAFAKDQLPAIRAAHPDAQFAIVGRAPTDAVKALAHLPGVIVTGGVPDTRDWLAAAAVVVAPLKLARGIQNKVLEAMAMAKAVVASPAAAEGIDAAPDRDFIVSDDPAVVIDLLNNPAKAKSIGQAARARMEARYSWAARLADLPGIMGFAT